MVLLGTGCSSDPAGVDFKHQYAKLPYFIEIALGVEYGDDPQRIRKWNDDVRLRMLGEFTAEDENDVRTVVGDLNVLVSPLRIDVVDYAPTLSVYFVPQSEFPNYLPQSLPPNIGVAWVWYDAQYRIHDAIVLVDSGLPASRLRSHIIREEITQALGLLNDSFRYADSIFYQGYSETTRFSDLDRVVIRWLYRDDVRAGMDVDEIRQVLGGR